MQSLPLAPKPLTTLHSFHSSYKVPIFLDEPMREAWPGRGLLTEMMGLCLQLDAGIVASFLHQHENEQQREKRVTFKQRLPAMVAALLERMNDQLTESSSSRLDLEGYLRESGLGLVFPRAELCLQEPDQNLARVATSVLDGYLEELTKLHMIVTLAQQLNSDIQLSSSHKYIAHQTALLYQCVGQSTAFPEAKRDIEQQFRAVKFACSGNVPRLTSDLQQWIVDVCGQLRERAMSVPSKSLSSSHPIISSLTYDVMADHAYM